MPRPAFKPTREQRTMVKSLAAIGMRHDHIAVVIGVRSPKTVRKHFRKELSVGSAEAVATVARVAYEMATSRKYPQMTEYWLSMMDGFAEPADIAETEAGRKPRAGACKMIFVSPPPSQAAQQEWRMPRKKFKPTEELRRKVKSLAGFGVSRQQICHLIGIRSVNTLRRHFRDELERGGIEALAKVQQTAFRLATSGRNPRMTMRWLERRAKWAPGMLLRPEPGEVQKYVWRVEVYQPPVPDDDPRRNGFAYLLQDRQPAAWDGDDPAGREHDAG